MSIPEGTVERLVQNFERRIADHQYERDSILIDRALRNTDDLIRQDRTYADQLRLVESHTLFQLPPDLVAFIGDHDSLYRAGIRSRQLAETAVSSPDMDVFTRVAHRILNLRNVYSWNIIRETRSPAERIRMMNDPQFEHEIREVTDALTNELFLILSNLEVLTPLDTDDIEMENVGPSPNVDDFGTVVSQLGPVEDPHEKDHSRRCCICLDAYNTSTHSAFLIAQCNHIVGKSCLATWLNSTSKNANLCPYCRSQLCERRARRPTSFRLTPAQFELVSRLERALDLLEDVDHLFNDIFGDEMTGVAHVEWLDNAVVELNRRLFENGVDFGFTRDGFEAIGWRLRRVDWAAGMLRA